MADVPWFRRAQVPIGFDGTSWLLRVPGTSQALRLNGTAAEIWDALEYPSTIEQLVGRCAVGHDAPPAIIEAEIRALVDTWIGRGLVAQSPAPGEEDWLRRRFLHLLKHSLTGATHPEGMLRTAALQADGVPGDPLERKRWLRDIRRHQPAQLANLTVSWRVGVPVNRAPIHYAHTCIGLSGLENIERCAEAVFHDGVPGDFLEAGVLAGGAAIFMRALQVAYAQSGRCVWAADSFQGVPPSTAAPDLESKLHLDEPSAPWICRSLDDVRDAFLRYDLLDDGVRFLPGWFRDTLPGPVERLAILRIDADLYLSTQEALHALYGKVSPGGFVIIDDYGSLEPCRRAVDEFRAARRIDAPLEIVNVNTVFWRIPA